MRKVVFFKEKLVSELQITGKNVCVCVDINECDIFDTVKYKISIKCETNGA